MKTTGINKANILVTGGAGFIGSNFIRYVFERTGFKGRILNYDKLTYAGDKANLKDVAARYGKRYLFVRGDIRDFAKLKKLIQKHDIKTIVNFAAETHVDRSIYGPGDFINTNINGTFSLLEVCRCFKGQGRDIRFHHISTDEVFGALGRTGKFSENSPYDPKSPYSASKAASDHLVRAYAHTYGLLVTISNCSNNYGPYQFPEKLIPLAILNALAGKPIPVYGDGLQVRDWLHVVDHCSAIWHILQKGRTGETYNVGGDSERKNIVLIRTLCGVLEEIFPAIKNPALKGRRYLDLITFVKDRPGHDRRYAINAAKIKRDLGWRPAYELKDGLRDTVRWYVNRRNSAPKVWSISH